MDKIKIRKYLRLAIVVVVSMIVGSVITIFIKNDNKIINTKVVKGYSKNANFDALYEAYDAIMKDYYKDVDSDKLVNGAINGMMQSLEDQHTMFFNEEQKDDFDTELSGQYYGIGAQIQWVEENKVQIIKIFDGAPAEKAGFKVGDIFVSIDGKSTDGLDANGVANILRSDKVSTSKVIVNRDGEEIEIEVTKANVTLFSVSSEILEANDKKVGYISVSLFGQKTYDQFQDALNKLEKRKIDSLIIDLRGNSGGYLTTVTDMLELFSKKGQVLYKIESSNGIREYKSTKNNEKNYKIIVLIDQSSASASEIMSAALKENLNATLVGKTTFGKGTVQVTKNLKNGTMIKYTIEKWLTPNGNNIDGEGVKPDFDIDLTEEYINNPTRENDSQLRKAIELLKE